MSEVLSSDSTIKFRLDGFEILKKFFHANQNPSLKERKAGLVRLKNNIINFKKEILSAFELDFKKPAFEVEASEILVCIREINLTLKNINYWTQDKPMDTDILLVGTHNYIKFEPKGVVLIVSPWNYPLLLAVLPLISAYAAGNKIVLKPSEFSPNVSQVIQKIIALSFKSEEVVCFLGGADLGSELVSMPFNHIFFTGSKKVARKILSLTAQNLTPVTLELGGKSPAIVDVNYDMGLAVERIAHAKILNAGQTCIAPDFVWIHRSKVQEFVVLWQLKLKEWFGSNMTDHPNYCGLIHENHFNRILAIVDASISEGAELAEEMEINSNFLKIKPTLLLNSKFDHTSMQDEIFGPLLPIIAYDDLESEIHLLQSMDRPLSLYIFSNTKSLVKNLLNNLRSGGVTWNNCLVNFCASNLPFGGDHQSGKGFTHGYYGFLEFSHQRAIAKQGILPSTLKLFYPPYTTLKKKLLNRLIKYFS